MLVKGDYTETMVELLRHSDAVHIGKNVLYLTQESSANTIRSGKLEKEYQVERTVGYFEGGSVGVTINGFTQIGGFNEDFIGYGNEDTEFFGRLAGGGIKFHNIRTEDLIHLWHARTDKWVEYHKINKVIEAEAVRRPMGERLSRLRSVLSKYGIDVNRYR
jgi:GT2 family glycosyltransferase